MRIILLSLVASFGIQLCAQTMTVQEYIFPYHAYLMLLYVIALITKVYLHLNFFEIVSPGRLSKAFIEQFHPIKMWKMEMIWLLICALFPLPILKDNRELTVLQKRLKNYINTLCLLIVFLLIVFIYYDIP